MKEFKKESPTVTSKRVHACTTICTSSRFLSVYCMHSYGRINKVGGGGGRGGKNDM